MRSSTAQATGTGTVVLDLGGTVGALIIYAGKDRCGQEIEISLIDQDSGVRRTHAVVREWPVLDAVFYSAVYPDVPEGVYQVWSDHSTPAGTVTVRGGSVAEFSWPTTEPGD